ncbi:MAG: hypothetical protein HY552_06330 [Elusimicrobia bacterium]|nr:hypothetical protein [Elusimicrobiota bacterium]
MVKMAGDRALLQMAAMGRRQVNGTNEAYTTCVVQYPARLDEDLENIAKAAAIICHLDSESVARRVYGAGRGKEALLPQPIVIVFQAPWASPGELCNTTFKADHSQGWIACDAERWRDKSLQRKGKGTFVHELFHLAVGYRAPSTYDPSAFERMKWLHEAFADYLAARHGFGSGTDWEQALDCRGKFRHYRDGYVCGAALLQFVDQTYGLNTASLARDLRSPARSSEGEAVAGEDLVIKNLRNWQKKRPSTFSALWDECRRSGNQCTGASDIPAQRNRRDAAQTRASGS